MVSGPRILLIEDDDAHAKIICRILNHEQANSRVERACDGEAALDMLHRRGVYEHLLRPNIIILDLKLRKISGHDVLKEIKSSSELKHIPVIVLTTSSVERDIEQAYESHVNSYLVKPVEPEDFKKMLSDLRLYWGVWNRTVSDSGGDGMNRG